MRVPSDLPKKFLSQNLLRGPHSWDARNANLKKPVFSIAGSFALSVSCPGSCRAQEHPLIEDYGAATSILGAPSESPGSRLTRKSRWPGSALRLIDIDEMEGHVTPVGDIRSNWQEDSVMKRRTRL
jgi:hypothetical protein